MIKTVGVLNEVDDDPPFAFVLNLFKFRQTTTRLIVEYYLHWTTTFEITFSGSSDTNHDSLL
jgi:hypothetical protein